MSDPGWKREIIELHDLFESYFLGITDDLSHAEASFAPDFTFVGPEAEPATRSETMGFIAAGHGHTSSLTINTLDHTLLFTDGDVTVAQYVEEHVLADRTNRRLTTAIFSVEPGAPNGVVWRRAHETWIDRGLA